MNFLTQLDAKSRETLRNRIKDVFAPQLNRAQLRYAPPNPAYNQAGPEGHSDLRPASNIANASENAQFVRVAHFWVEQGPGEVNLGQTDEVDKGGNESFIVTPTVKVYLTDLARAAVARKYVLVFWADRLFDVCQCALLCLTREAQLFVSTYWRLKVSRSSTGSNIKWQDLNGTVPRGSHGSHMCTHQQSRAH